MDYEYDLYDQITTKPQKQSSNICLTACACMLILFSESFKIKRQSQDKFRYSNYSKYLMER